MKQRPVAWMQTFVNQDGDEKNFSLSWERIGVNDIPLYAAPRELSDEEIKEIADSVCHKWKKNGIGEMYLEDFARAILKKASEK